MKAFSLCFLACVAVSSAFRPTLPSRFVVPSQTRLFEQNSLVPVEKANIENAAAVTGGIVGFALGGPVVALILAAVSNYAVKKDNDAGVALRGFGKVVIESYNYLTTLNQKYELTGKASEAVKTTVNKAAAENESLDQVTKTLDTTVTKVSEINKEFDLVTKAKQALVAAGTLSDAALEKVEELNAKVSMEEIHPLIIYPHFLTNKLNLMIWMNPVWIDNLPFYLRSILFYFFSFSCLLLTIFTV